MKDKLNNRGFTLVELLASLVILITILTIAITSITSSVERNKEHMYEKKKEIILAAAESHYELYKNNYVNFEDDPPKCYIELIKIVEDGILRREDIKDSSGNDFSFMIKVTIGNNGIGNFEIENNSGSTPNCF